MLFVGRGMKKWLSTAYHKHAQLDLNLGTLLTNPCGLQLLPQDIDL
jgi:hypothetical protein